MACCGTSNLVFTVAFTVAFTVYVLWCMYYVLCAVCIVHPDATEEEHCKVGERELIDVDAVSLRITPAQSPAHNNPPISPSRLLFAILVPFLGQKLLLEGSYSQDRADNQSGWCIEDLQTAHIIAGGWPTSTPSILDPQ